MNFSDMTMIATAAFGLEGVAANELKRMNIAAKAENGGARFAGTLEDAFRANLYLRTADRVLMVLAEKKGTYIYDGSLVMGNLMLAAHELGIGSCWIHRAKEVFEQEEWKQWLKSLGLKGEYEGIGNCVLGYVEGEYPGVLPRKENRVYFVE